MSEVECRLIHDHFQNAKSYNIPRAQLMIADIPFNIGSNFYVSRPDWYVEGIMPMGRARRRTRQRSIRTSPSISRTSSHSETGYLSCYRVRQYRRHRIPNLPVL